MATDTATSAVWNLEELFEKLGPLPLSRLRAEPLPGEASEEDVLSIYEREKRLYELADGILVAKTMGFLESFLAMELGYILKQFLGKPNLGIVVDADAMVRLAPGLIRIPDVSFISWNRLPARKMPREAIPDLVPNLAVEVLSPGNTKKEMDRKLRDYFDAGVELVWFVDPRTETITVYTSPHRKRVLSRKDTLDGGEVLAGFKLSIDAFFARAEQQGP